MLKNLIHIFKNSWCKAHYMKIIYTLLAILYSLNTHAQDIKNEFEGGSHEYDPIHYTPAYISKAISDNMKIQCSNGLCEMAMVDTQGRSFIVEVYTGYGSLNGMYGTSMGGNTGGSVVVLGNGQINTTPQLYYGVTLRYINQHCKQSIRVPTSLYVSMNTYLYSLINEDGTTKRTFDPAEQTMILFYTTVMNQANGCNTVTR